MDWPDRYENCPATPRFWRSKFLFIEECTSELGFAGLASRPSAPALSLCGYWVRSFTNFWLFMMSFGTLRLELELMSTSMLFRYMFYNLIWANVSWDCELMLLNNLEPWLSWTKAFASFFEVYFSKNVKLFKLFWLNWFWLISEYLLISNGMGSLDRASLTSTHFSSENLEILLLDLCWRELEFYCLISEFLESYNNY